MHLLVMVTVVMVTVVMVTVVMVRVVMVTVVMVTVVNCHGNTCIHLAKSTHVAAEKSAYG